jgi:CDP-diacylglycerol--glycerol-3-phosphate 3-phosphatidyltransferase
MNLPNKLTILRIALVGVFMFFLLSPGLIAKCLAFATFLAASLTDLLDGYIAKKYNMVTDFGKLMDPIADKILVLSAFLAFVQMELIPAWMALVIVFRELAVTGLRIAALAQRRVLSADDGGKHKMVSQVVSVFVILLFVIFKEARAGQAGPWSGIAQNMYSDTIYILMLITTVLTLISGVSYLVKNKEVYINAKTG